MRGDITYNQSNHVDWLRTKFRKNSNNKLKIEIYIKERRILIYSNYVFPKGW